MCNEDRCVSIARIQQHPTFLFAVMMPASGAVMRDGGPNLISYHISITVILSYHHH